MTIFNRMDRQPRRKASRGSQQPKEPQWRQDARNDADDTGPLAAWMFLAFVTITVAVISYYLIFHYQP